MSFRKRGDVISTGGRIPPAVPGRGSPIGVPEGVPAVPGRGPVPVPGRNPIVPGRAPIGGSGLRAPPGSNTLQNHDLSGRMKALSVEEEFKHPGIRPSTINSQSTVSTGCADLDKILGHSGLPLGSFMLLEESGTTDFGSVLVKAFASQGVVHNRLDPKSSNTHVIVITSNSQWGKELPGLYKGSSRDIKKQKVRENENKVSVQNMIDNDSRSTPRPSKPAVERDSDLRIAWRYGLNDVSKKQSNLQLDNEIYKDFNHQFDITSRLTPSPGSNEITYLPLSTSFTSIIKQIELIVQQHKNKIIRLVIPSFLHPAMYPPTLTSSQEVIPFIHQLRSLTQKHSKLVISVTLSLDLFPRDTALVKHIENLVDAVFHLEPFNQEMIKFLEKAYHNQPTKVQHGLVHVYKIPYLSEKGHMMVMKSEFAFKNGRKKFEIEEWGIPVEDEEEPSQTTQNIDF
ncbi:CYFA0S05e01948g1_1 [Cyberlindnera fabianii]|uniref:Elongator complex protein 4 n=1 Tax=Cyberlindnera fabianii TaxID=36022 RepID=A0A061ASG6_CYBFA|nr:CYFA0S05e01948g1_1 [Cyberlindnera fabianii]